MEKYNKAINEVLGADVTEKYNKAINEVLRADVTAALNACRIGQTRILEMACMTAFENQLTGEHIELLRKVKLNLTKTGLLNMDGL